MASKRRGGFRPPEIRGTLGTLLRTTTDVVRDALERGAREGRARLDDVRARGRRQDALAELGEIVLDLIRRGEIDLDELPEARAIVRQLDEHDEGGGHDAGHDDDDAPRASARRRFDDRGASPVSAPHDDHRPGHELGSSFERRPREGRGTSPYPPAPVAAPRRKPSEDGTVSSGAALRATRPTTPARPREPSVTSRAMTKPIKGVWRPDPEAEGPPEEVPASPSRRYQLAPDPHRKGGISFEGDDDLAEYMHPDDVPARDQAKDDPAGHDPDHEA